MILEEIESWFNKQQKIFIEKSIDVKIEKKDQAVKSISIEMSNDKYSLLLCIWANNKLESTLMNNHDSAAAVICHEQITYEEFKVENTSLIQLMLS